MKATLDGKPIEKLEFHQAGEDGEFLWIRFHLKNGEKYDSYYLKGTT